MSRVRRQHIINEAYLAHFCDASLDPPQVWVYEKHPRMFEDFEKYEPATRTPHNVCVQRDFYEGGDMPINAVEKALSKIEGDFESVVQNKLMKREPLTPQDNRAIAMYVSMMRARTEGTKANLDAFCDRMIARIEAMERQHNIPPKTSTEWKEAKENNEMFIINIIESQALDIYQLASWVVLVNETFADGWHFITSDDPMCVYDFELMNSFYGVPAWSKTTEVTLPVTSTIALVGNYLDISGYEKAHPNEIEEVNNRTLSHAKKAMYSSRKLKGAEVEKLMKRNRQTLALGRAVSTKVVTRNDRLVKKYERVKKISKWMVSKWWLRWIFVLIQKRRLRNAANQPPTSEDELDE